MTLDDSPDMDDLDRLLAACDEAVASGEPTDTLLTPNLSDDLRERLENEVAWCRLVRRLLPAADGSTAEGPTDVLSRSPDGAADVDVPVLQQLGRFHIRRELGRGGFGVVFLAYDPALGRDVALKVPRPEAIVSPEVRARFQHEARAAASLDHPNLVPVYETGVDGLICYIAAAYCPGVNLSAWLKKREGPVSADQAARLLVALAEAVDHAHTRGILHRDLKPSNVMLSPRPIEDAPTADVHAPPTFRDGAVEYIPRVMDFGLAKVLDDVETALTCDFSTRTGAVLGTPDYMAPEQAGGKGVDVGPAADVHALGAILYEVLTGRPPFRGADPVETLVRVRTADAVPPSRLRPDLPRDIETICLKCLNKAPRHRYPTAKALAADLHRYLTRRPIQARRTGPLGRAWLWSKRNPALAATIVLSLTAVTAVAGTGLYQVLQERERYRTQRDRAEKNLYLALVGEARALMQARDTGWWWKAMDAIRQASALEVADRDPAELRELAIQCIGTRYPSMRLRGTWEGHTAAVTCSAFSRDGTRAATGSRDQTVRVWSVPDGSVVAVLGGHSQGVTGVAFDPQGRWIASSSLDGVLRLWPMSGGAVEAIPREVPLGAGPINALEVSPDGHVLAAGCQDGTIRLVDPRATSPGEAAVRSLTGHAAAVNCLAFFYADGQLATGGQDGTIRFWNVGTGRETDYWTVGAPPTTLVFGPDYGGALVFTGIEFFGLHKSTLNRGRTGFYGELHSNSIRQVRLVMPCRGGKHRLLTASADGTLKLWRLDTEAGTHLQEDAVAGGELGAVNTVAVDPLSGWVVAGHADGRVRVWELAEPPERNLEGAGSMQGAAFLGASRVMVNNYLLHDYTPTAGPAGAGPLRSNWDRPNVSLYPTAVTALATHTTADGFAYGDRSGLLVIGHGAAGARVDCGRQASGIAGLAVSPDGTRLASGDEDGKVKVWDWKTGNCLHTLEPGLGPIHAIAWAGDSRTLAVTGERGAALGDPAVPASLRQVAQHSLRMSAVAIQGDHLAVTGPEGTVRVLNRHTLQLIHTVRGHTAPVTALAFSPDGRWLASAATSDRVRLWDASNAFGERPLPDPGTQTWSALTFSPDGRFLAASASSTWVWDLQGGPVPVVFFPGMFTRFSADGASLLHANRGGVFRWTISALTAARDKTRGKSDLSGSTFTPQGSGPDALVEGAHTNETWGVAASPDGKWMVTTSADQTAKLWDVRSNALVRTLRGHEEVVWCAAFSPDSKYVATGSVDAADTIGDIRIWEVATGREVRRFQGHKRLVSSLAFHPTQHWLVSSALDGSICVWDLTGGASPGQIHKLERGVFSVAISPDGGRMAASCLDTRVAVWDLPETVTAPLPPTRFLEGHTAGVYSVGFSPDGRYLSSGSEQGVIILWDVKTLARVVTLRSGTAQVRCTAFSRDSQLLAGAAYGGPTVVWDLGMLRQTLAAMSLDW